MEKCFFCNQPANAGIRSVGDARQLLVCTYCTVNVVPALVAKGIAAGKKPDIAKWNRLLEEFRSRVVQVLEIYQVNYIHNKENQERN